MTESMKLLVIKQWIDEAIRQGNNSVLVWAIKSILEEDCVIESKTSPIKLSEKSMQILKRKKESELESKMFPEITLPEGSAEFVDKVIADAGKHLKEIEK